ncbi:MAG TPA: LuxR C-terminal-related transcriptional regulator [Acidimicrobiales bacterium]|nr:LuxR C-terminal-related transcriptional regulator [Acidimicrobiales bacterium]
MGQPTIELVGPADLDRARVALVVAEATDDGAAKVVKAIQRDGVPRVVLVACRFDEAGVLVCVAAGATSFLRRTEATSAKLTEAIRDADQAGCRLPEGLIRRATAALPVDEVTADTPTMDLRDRGGSTITLRLTARESEVLRLVADGFDTSDIAEQLAYSESTIKGVLAKIMGRLDARNRCHAVAIVVREGLI